MDSEDRDDRAVQGQETVNTPDNKMGIIIGFLVVALLLVAAIVYACFLYRRLMKSAEFNRRVSTFFGPKFSRKKNESIDLDSALTRDDRQDKTAVGETPNAPPRGRVMPKDDQRATAESSTYLDMSALTKGHGDGAGEEAPIYETLDEQEEASAYAIITVKKKTSVVSLNKGEDNPIYENLDQDTTDPLYINITPSVTPVPSPSHSPRTRRKLTKQESDAYIIMSSPGGN